MKHRKLRVLPVTILAFLAFPSTVPAYHTLNQYFPSDDSSWKKICDGYLQNKYGNLFNAVKLKDSKILVSPNIDIGNFDSGTGDAIKLGVTHKVGEPWEEVKPNIYEEIEKKLPDLSGFSDLVYEPEIKTTYDDVKKKCIKEKKSHKVCSAKVASTIETLYGEKLVKLSCYMRLQGTEFPVLAFTTCSLSYGIPFKAINETRHEFLDYFDPDLAEKAVVSLFLKYAEIISQVVPQAKEFAKRCNL